MLFAKCKLYFSGLNASWQNGIHFTRCAQDYEISSVLTFDINLHFEFFDKTEMSVVFKICNAERPAPVYFT